MAVGWLVASLQPERRKVMDYNTGRGKLVLPKYGRYVQDLVDYCKGLEDREERTRCAVGIVRVMKVMFPSESDKVLWDHLVRIAGYELDVDYPVTVATEEESSERPQRLTYPKGGIKAMHYGRLMQTLIETIAEMPAGEERDALLELTALQMGKELLCWNKDSLTAEKIADDIARYSDGKLQVDASRLKLPRPVESVAPAARKSVKRRKR